MKNEAKRNLKQQGQYVLGEQFGRVSAAAETGKS
jgi:hypothetical protein